MTNKLKLNEHLHLSENTLRLLSQNRIATILDFLEEDVSKLAAITKLNLGQILAIRDDIFTKYSAVPINGVEILNKCQASRKCLSTGIKSLDAMLQGGIPLGFIIEVCGLSDSGKTQLCLQLAVNCARYSDNTVLYVDTKGDFSAIRIQKMLDASGCSHEEMAVIMYKIRVVRIWTMEELVEFFKKLKRGSISIDKLTLIIIDSLPCLTLQYVGDDNKIGLTFLNIFVNYCRYLCKELNIAVVCVNIQTRWVDQDLTELEDGEESSSTFKENYIEKRNRCLGKYWHYIPFLVLQLEKNQQNNQNTGSSELQQINVTVLNSNSLSINNKQCNIDLSAEGIK